jgi:hypothetical protein
MRVSEVYSLELGQPALDFVNVDVERDARVYLDPRALRLLPTEWGSECVSLIQDFFGYVLEAIRDGRREEALTALEQLREPNETHLGMSKGVSRGRALGPGSAGQIYDALATSEAIKTGLLQDLEETALMVEGIAYDIVSDIATNIIRGPLIAYTQTQAALLGIPLERQGSGPLWNPGVGWFSELRDLPRAGSPARKLLLVPKVIVRATLHYNAADYFNNYVLNFLIEDEIQKGSELVRLLKDGRPNVTKKDLKEKYGQGKRVATKVTLEHTEILEEYRQRRGSSPPRPYSHEDLLERTDEQPAEPDWPALVDAVRAVSPGGPGATAFHKAAQALLTAAMWPSLAMPVREQEIHEGRKRIDIKYTNIAQAGFFNWVGMHFPAATVAVECKNYSSDPANPELDQLSGRFSPSRGKLGLLVCRSFQDKQLFLGRCRDTARDDRGFIIPLDDDDLEYIGDRRANHDGAAIDHLFRERFDLLVN